LDRTATHTLRVVRSFPKTVSRTMESQRLVVLLTILVNFAWTPAESSRFNVDTGVMSDPHEVLSDRAADMMAMMRTVDVSDRNIKQYFTQFQGRWSKYQAKVKADSTLYCKEGPDGWEGLKKDLDETKTEIGLIRSGLTALQTQLTKIRDILAKPRGAKSGLHCEVVPKPDICKALDDLDASLTEQLAKIDKEEKLVDDEIKLVMEYDCNCEYNAWAGKWGACSVTCEDGTQVETRQIKWNKRNNGAECKKEDATRSQACNDGCCPVDCVMENWSKWTPCPEWCGDTKDPANKDKKKQFRNRGVAVAMECNGKACDKNTQESKECDIISVRNQRIEELEKQLADKCPNVSAGKTIVQAIPAPSKPVPPVKRIPVSSSGVSGSSGSSSSGSGSSSSSDTKPTFMGPGGDPDDQ